jgi:uncharacterized repeat protein (TIGR04076 family)
VTRFLKGKTGGGMKKVKITVVKMVRHEDLIEDFENPLELPCGMTVGEVFVANGWQKTRRSL